MSDARAHAAVAPHFAPFWPQGKSGFPTFRFCACTSTRAHARACAHSLTRMRVNPASHASAAVGALEALMALPQLRPGFELDGTHLSPVCDGVRYCAVGYGSRTGCMYVLRAERSMLHAVCARAESSPARAARPLQYIARAPHALRAEPHALHPSAVGRRSDAGDLRCRRTWRSLRRPCSMSLCAS